MALASETRLESRSKRVDGAAICLGDGIGAGTEAVAFGAKPLSQFLQFSRVKNLIGPRISSTELLLATFRECGNLGVARSWPILTPYILPASTPESDIQ